MKSISTFFLFCLSLFAIQSSYAKTDIIPLDGIWQLSFDRQNQGKEKKWWESKLPNTIETQVPGNLERHDPQHNGWVWYERSFETPRHVGPNGKIRLKFWQVFYFAEVWINGKYIGQHEGAEDPFVFDITNALNPEGTENRLIVRVMNPTSMRNEPPFERWTVSGAFGCGGIIDSVELLVSPAVYLEDLHLIPDCKTGSIKVRIRVMNSESDPVQGSLSLSASHCKGTTSGNTEAELHWNDLSLIPGENLLEKSISIPNFRLWNLNDPNLYFVTARFEKKGGSGESDTKSDRCGFRDFRFENGFFRLNGKRIYLKSSHTGASTPVSGRIPLDPDFLRKDLILSKAMNFNMIRFIGIEGVARRFQLDLCDEIGLLVYEECCTSCMLGPSPWRAKRFINALEGMLHRDRNHPCIVCWGLLNEISHVPTLLQASQIRERVHELAPGRVVFFNSGSFDPFKEEYHLDHPISGWHFPGTLLPFIALNESGTTIPLPRGSLPDGYLALMPQVNMMCAAVRWTAQEDGPHQIDLGMKSLGPWETKYQLFHEKKELEKGEFYNHGSKRTKNLEYSKTLDFRKGESFWIVLLNETPAAIEMTVVSPNGIKNDIRKDFSWERNPNGPWTFGSRVAGKLSSHDFEPFTTGQESFAIHSKKIGRISNPGSSQWEDLLADVHRYVKQTPESMKENLKEKKEGDYPIFLSEYGFTGGVDLARLMRKYEQYQGTNVTMYFGLQESIKNFQKVWQEWKLNEIFLSPEEYFRQTVARCAELRRFGINALRANPAIVGYSLTGTNDPGICGEGLTSAFRELKPGHVDVLAELFSPLRFSLFIDPIQIYSGEKLKFEIVLVNEDILPAGRYPVRITIRGPQGFCAYDKKIDITVPERSDGKENPFALSVYSDEFVIKGPAGDYFLRADMQEKAACSGGPERFYLNDHESMPLIQRPCIVWGKDQDLIKKLDQLAIKTISFDEAEKKGLFERTGKEAPVILLGENVSNKNQERFNRLWEICRKGAHVVILAPQAVQNYGVITEFLPFDKSECGSVKKISRGYTCAEDWNKFHSFFQGMPCGTFLDPVYYANLMPECGLVDLKTPDEVIAGSCISGHLFPATATMVLWQLGKGSLLLNTFQIQKYLGSDPSAELLLRNIINMIE